MRGQGLDRQVMSMLGLHDKVDVVAEDEARSRWGNFVTGLTGRKKHKIAIGITGKYAALRDAYASIDKALEHCAAELSADIDVDWIDTTDMNPNDVTEELQGLHGVIVPGGFGSRGVEGKIACVKYCRENKIPYLGICLGFQVAVIEYARNVLSLSNASSTEFNASTDAAVISELPEQKEIEGLGGSMRLGGQRITLDKNSLAAFLYNSTSARERFRHRWEVEPRFIKQFEQAGLIFSGKHPDHNIMQVLELTADEHPYFIGGQFHPELTSRPANPNPLFAGLIATAIKQAAPELDRNAISQRWLRPFEAKHHVVSPQPEMTIA